MGHAPRNIAESRQVASSEIRRLKASPAGSSIERKAGRRRRDRRGSHACVHVTLNEVTGYGDDCANYRPAGAGAKVLEDAAPARRRAPGPNASASTTAARQPAAPTPSNVGADRLRLGACLLSVPWSLLRLPGEGVAEPDEHRYRPRLRHPPSRATALGAKRPRGYKALGSQPRLGGHWPPKT